MVGILGESDPRLRQKAEIEVDKRNSKPIVAQYFAQLAIGGTFVFAPWFFQGYIPPSVRLGLSIVGGSFAVAAASSAGKLEEIAERVETTKKVVRAYDEEFVGTELTTYQKLTERLIQSKFAPQQQQAQQQELPEWHNDRLRINAVFQAIGIKAWVRDRQLTETTVRWILDWDMEESINNIQGAIKKRGREFKVVAGLVNPVLVDAVGKLYIEVPRNLEWSEDSIAQPQPEYAYATPEPPRNHPEAIPPQSISYTIAQPSAPMQQGRSDYAAPQHLVIADWAKAVVDGTIPSKYRWVRDTINYPCVLVWGAQGSGKSSFARFNTRCRVLAGHKTEVWNPHGKYGEWNGLKIVGKGMDYLAIDEAMLQFEEDVKEEYQKLSTIPNYEPEYYSYVVEELTNYADRCTDPGAFLKTCFSDIRKARRCVLLISHNRTMETIGGGKGLAKTRDNGVLELQLLSRIDPNTGESVPMGRGKLRYPGKTEWMDVEVPAWMNGAEDFSDIVQTQNSEAIEEWDDQFEDKFGFDPDDAIDSIESTSPIPAQPATDVYEAIALWLAANPGASRAAVKIKFKAITPKRISLNDAGLNLLLQQVAAKHPEVKGLCDRLLSLE